MKKIVGSTPELSATVFISLDKYQLKIWVENSVFAIQHIENKKSFTEVLSHTSHTSYKNSMIGHRCVCGGGGQFFLNLNYFKRFYII